MIINMNVLTACPKVSLFLILLNISIFGASSSFEFQCRQRERLALLKFKAELIDDFGRLSSWGNEGDDETDCCWWEGVVCDIQTNHVVALDLHDPPVEFFYSDTPLRGKISLSLLELTRLNYLDLSYNDFNWSKIPEFIGSLGKLQHLNLSYSNFVGMIPHSLGNLSMLNLLDLSGNIGLVSTNIDWLSGFESLEYLDLGMVDLRRATTWLQTINKLTVLKEIHLMACQPSTDLLIPLPSVNASNSLVVIDLSRNSFISSSPILLRFLNMSSSFRYIDFSFNNLEGRIPDVLEKLKSLSHLDLKYNELKGDFPPPSKNLSMLRFVDLSGNQLNGQLSQFTLWLWDSTMLGYISLSDNMLYGSLPNMSRYPSLKELMLGDNKLNESLNESNLRLPNLEVLDFSRNKFSGRVPNLSSCSSLRRLILHHNMFNGTLPESIGYLSKVEYLNINSNHLESLISEAHFSNLSNLRELDLSFNSNITIRISSSWNPPFQLSALRVAGCKLGPSFPQWLRNQRGVRSIDISNAKISDTIPDWFWDNGGMFLQLNMSYNWIHGVLPDLSSQLNLRTLDLSSNEFNGSLPLLPPEVFNIDLSRNKFSGTILNVCNITYYFATLDLSNNLLSGEIPQDCFMKLMRIGYLNLANNNFSGEISNLSDMACVVYSLHLRNNSFTGEIPGSLKNCYDLRILDLGKNKFTGKIPLWLGENMPKLGVLILKSNKLYGTVPLSICDLTKLQVLDISVNQISGTIPKCIKNFTILSSKDLNPRNPFIIGKFNATISDDSAYVMWKGKESQYVNALRLLKTIDLSSNNLTGEIPVEVTSLVGLLALNLLGNNLVGSIPHDIDQLELLNFLDLSKNKLSGGIPSTISQLSHLGVLDLSFNNLSGRIPWDTHLQTFNASTFMGNPGLCGSPLVSKPCPEDEMPEKPRDGMNNFGHENMYITKGFYISMVLGFIVAFWGIFGTLFLNKWWHVTILKLFIIVEDWLYVKILVNKRRFERYFENH